MSNTTMQKPKRETISLLGPVISEIRGETVLAMGKFNEAGQLAVCSVNLNPTLSWLKK